MLRAANPWWSRRRRASWVLDDPELVQRARHPWAPATSAARTELADLGHRPLPRTVTLVVGPRGVGKTTAVKDVVAHLVADPAVDPRCVVLVPALRRDDERWVTLLDGDALTTVLRAPTRAGAPACDGPRVLVVDEVGTVTGWPAALATACTRGDQVIATTSVLDPADLAALEGALPEGSVRVRHLRPSSLAEILLASPAGATGDVRTAYLRHGGLPRAVAEHRALGDVSTGFVHDLVDGLRHDVCRGDDRHAVDVLLSALCATTDRFVEPAALAAALGLAPAEVTGLLRRLEQAHVLDPHRGLVDPLLHRLPSLVAPGSHTAPTPDHIATFSH